MAAKERESLMTKFIGFIMSVFFPSPDFSRIIATIHINLFSY